jgi:hypothetical protein
MQRDPVKKRGRVIPLEGRASIKEVLIAEILMILKHSSRWI